MEITSVGERELAFIIEFLVIVGFFLVEEKA